MRRSFARFRLASGRVPSYHRREALVDGAPEARPAPSRKRSTCRRQEGRHLFEVPKAWPSDQEEWRSGPESDLRTPQLSMLAAGLDGKEIADRLLLSPRRYAPTYATRWHTSVPGHASGPWSPPSGWRRSSLDRRRDRRRGSPELEQPEAYPRTRRRRYPRPGPVRLNADGERREGGRGVRPDGSVAPPVGPMTRPLRARAGPPGPSP